MAITQPNPELALSFSRRKHLVNRSDRVSGTHTLPAGARIELGSMIDLWVSNIDPRWSGLWTRFSARTKVQRQRTSRLCQRSSVSCVTSRPARTCRKQPGQGGEYRPVSPGPTPAWGSGAAAPQPPGTVPAARRPSTPPSVPAAPSSRPGGRTSGRASVPSQARNAASSMTNTAAEPTGQPLMCRFGTLQALAATA
jgi:hypothetical protein